MNTYEYIGTFKNAGGHTYTLTVRCNGFLQALVLLTADAIRLGKHYQLLKISNEKQGVRYIDDIVKITKLIS